MLQHTLWKSAIFPMGSQLPTTWTHVNMKKDFLPRLTECLKNAAFGAPVALYENFVKFVSVCPLWQLQPAKQHLSGTKNKVSLKDRCNLLRELMAALYAALTHNDEAVAFHGELVACYFETLTFLILKRFQPLMLDEDASDDEKALALQQLQKMISLPGRDFTEHYEKF